MLKIPRRSFLHLAAGTAAAALAPMTAFAQAYPSRPVRLVVGFPPGGSADAVARIVSEWLSVRLGHPVLVENRPGASGNIGTEDVVRAAPDGHTLLFATSTNSVNAALFQNLSFDFGADIAPVAGISRNPFVMEVNPAVPATTVAEFIAYAKANPGKLAMGSAGNGTPHHLFGELFKMMTGITMLHVPYRGEAPALTDLMAGQVQVLFSNAAGPALEFIRAGKLRALAVTTAARLDTLPGVPTVAEVRAGVRGERLVRPWRAKGHAGCDHYAPQCRDQSRSRRPDALGAPRRHRGATNADDTGGVRRIHRRRYGEVDESRSLRRHQAAARLEASGPPADRERFIRRGKWLSWAGSPP